MFVEFISNVVIFDGLNSFNLLAASRSSKILIKDIEIKRCLSDSDNSNNNINSLQAGKYYKNVHTDMILPLQVPMKHFFKTF